MLLGTIFPPPADEIAASSLSTPEATGCDAISSLPSDAVGTKSAETVLLGSLKTIPCTYDLRRNIMLTIK